MDKLRDKIYRHFNHKKEIYKLSAEVCKLRQEVRELIWLVKKNGQSQNATAHQTKQNY